MKVKYLFDDESLKFEGEYNVFAIEDWGVDGKKIYISDFDLSGRYYISPFDFDAFKIIDTKISKFWEYGINQFGNECISIPEIFNQQYFWERYYDEDKEINSILDLYYKIGKEELFNVE